MRFMIAMILLVFSGVAHAQSLELPYCEVRGYGMECRRPNSTFREMRYVPGCNVSCPEDKSPVCKAGVLSNDCSIPAKMPVCKCE